MLVNNFYFLANTFLFIFDKTEERNKKSYLINKTRTFLANNVILTIKQIALLDSYNIKVATRGLK